MRLTKDQLYKPYGVTGSSTSTAATTAENVTIADSGSLIDATTVEGALAELATDIAAIPSATTAVANHANADGAGGVNEPATNKVHNASAIEFADGSTLYVASDVEAGLTEAMTVHNAHKNADGAGGSSAPPSNMAHNAAAVGFADGSSLFTASTVEAALTEEAGKRIQGKHFFSMAKDEFPLQQCYYKNAECDNTLDSDDCTPITITTISTSSGTINGYSFDGYIIVTYLPYRPSLWTPVSGEEWAMIDLEDHDGDPEPDRFGDYTTRMRVVGGVYADKKLYLSNTSGGGTVAASLAEGDRILLYNPHEAANGWEWLNSGNYLIGASGSGWRKKYVEVCGVFKHSDGTYRMIVHGRDGSNNFSIGAFSSSDLVTWTVMNSDAAYFVPSTGTAWRYSWVFGGSGVHYLDHEERYFLPCLGKNSSGRMTLGWVKFDEDFGNIEYAATEPVTRSAGYDHYYPAVVHYGGKWMITYGVDESPTDVYAWKTKCAFSNRPEGPYTDAADIIDSSTLTAIKSNDGIYCSSHFTDFMPFVWRGRLYALAFGCSKYNFAGNRGNLEMGLWYYNERLATPVWECDPRSPVFFNAMYAQTDLWGSNFTWQNDHIGGRMAIYQENQYLYIFHGGSAGTDSYKICGRRLTLS